MSIATQEAERWLLSKADSSSREIVRSGEVFTQGVHRISPGAEVTVVRADRPDDGSRRIRIQLVEQGGWEASITAVDYAAGNRRRDALVVTATNAEDPRGEWVAAPPRLVRDLLARTEIFDGVTQVTAEPQFVGRHEVDDLVAAVTDRTRSVSVIIAGSVGIHADDALRTRLKQLTSQVVGAAAVYLVREDTLPMLNERLGPSHTVLPGRVRTFLPLVDLDDPLDAKRHRVLGPDTFARALRGNSVARHLQEAFAVETRTALLARPLPADVRRSLEVLDAEHSRLTREHRIAERAAKRMTAADPELQTLETPSVDDVLDVHSARSEATTTPKSAEHLPVIATRVLDRLRALASRWLGSAEPLTESTIDGLEARLARESATAEDLLESASRLEEDLGAAIQDVADLRTERDDLDLELTVADEDAAKLRAQIRHLQATLVAAQLYTEAYSVADPDQGWDAPPSVVELANVLRSESVNPHRAFARVEFTGDISDVEDVQKRDTVGRYAAAFWEFVRTLHDYAELKESGAFNGNVHMYLNSEAAGYKCSPQRHAAKESDSVLSNASWRAERVRPVPVTVAESGAVLMEAHFKPTHADTVAPRMHYYDDTDNSGKIFIGYIGRHLTNTRTQNS